MLLLEAVDVKKYYRDKLILEFKEIKVDSKDKIGIVGNNGSGKTTLLNILGKKVPIDNGHINGYSKTSYISQLGLPEETSVDIQIAKKFNIDKSLRDYFSGGERTKYKIVSALGKDSSLLLADEPTSHLDVEGIQILENELKKYSGAILLVSHDRELLENVVNKIIEVEDNGIEIYNCGYKKYLQLKKEKISRKNLEYKIYVKEKEDIKKAIIETRLQSENVRKTPKRMGNSEARLHKMGGQGNKKKLDSKVKSLEKKLEKLEEKEKYTESKKIRLDVGNFKKSHSKMAIEGKSIFKKVGTKIIFKCGDLSIYNGKKIALVGDNGSGKTTLLEMIVNDNNQIKISKNLIVSYFRQDIDDLEANKSVMENLLKDSKYNQSSLRTLLARIHFKEDDIYKKIKVLSGGEKVRVSLLKAVTKENNILILDEPTNYLDIDSMKVLEELLKEYEGTLIVVSHDRKFLKNIAEEIVYIENKEIKRFLGSYDEFIDYKNNPKDIEDKKLEEGLYVLENKLSSIIGEISIESNEEKKSKLDKEYFDIIGKIKELKNKNQ